jgi:hypothetical protein
LWRWRIKEESGVETTAVRCGRLAVQSSSVCTGTGTKSEALAQAVSKVSSGGEFTLELVTGIAKPGGFADL